MAHKVHDKVLKIVIFCLVSSLGTLHTTHSTSEIWDATSHIKYLWKTWLMPRKERATKKKDCKYVIKINRKKNVSFIFEDTEVSMIWATTNNECYSYSSAGKCMSIVIHVHIEGGCHTDQTFNCALNSENCCSFVVVCLFAWMGRSRSRFVRFDMMQNNLIILLILL